jgi:multisubunit Na+/H+ antiporter MnhB subunit
MIKVPFYIKALRVLAPIIIFLGVWTLFLGFSVATGFIVEPEPGRYLGSKTSGQKIDQGIYLVFVGIVVGAISEIGNALFKNQKME